MEEKEKIEEITTQLEQGIRELFESKKYADYLKTLSKLHNYSFNNTVLISLQKPDATMVAGYNSWKNNFHRYVKKGERGIRILAPSPYKIDKEIEKIDPETNSPVLGKDGIPIKEVVKVTIPAFRITTVFDVSQTEGKPIPELASKLEDTVENYTAMFNAIKDISPVPIEIRKVEGSSNGYYHLKEKIIVVDEGMSQAQTIKTAIHELSHAKLHDLETGSEQNADSVTKEVQAESIAYTVCSHFGLDTSDYSFGYIAGWSGTKNLDELKSSMSVIRSTASEIINELDKKLNRNVDETIDKRIDDDKEMEQLCNGVLKDLHDFKPETVSEKETVDMTEMEEIHHRSH